VAIGNASTDAVTADQRSLLLTWQPHPSQHQSYPHKRSDTCCYLSRHSYGIWLSDVPRELSYNRSMFVARSACGDSWS
jgi:hypothetical protein